jgi:hypothetical protein
VVAILYGLGSITFVIGIYNTSTANLVFILAFNTAFAALLSWIFLKQRPQPVTLVAMGAMILGVLIIVYDSIGSGNVFGDVMALCSAFLIASAITISRHSGKDMGFTALIGVVFPFLVAAFVVADTGSYRIDAPWWIIFNGAVVMPISFYCLATGRHLRAGGGNVLPARDRAGAGLGVDDLCGDTDHGEPDRWIDPHRGAGGAFSLQLHDGRRRRAAGNFRHV